MKTARWMTSGRMTDGSHGVRVSGATLLVAWVDFIGCLPWELFITLTCDPRRVFPVEGARMEKEALKWCGLIGWTFRRPVAWLIASERGRSGQWHAHVLLAGAPPDISVLATLWELRNGRIKVQPVTDVNGAVLYSTKNAALSGDVVLSDTVRRYRQQFSNTPGVALFPQVIEKHDQ